jgi:dCTP deaminase
MPVSKPYSGHHGYETKIWPVPTQFYASPDLLKEQKIEPMALDEIQRSYGPLVRSLEERLRRYERKIWIQILLTVIGFLAIASFAGRIDWWIAILLAVVANFVTNLLAFGFRSLFRR